jgi:hypothetical protein
MEEQYNQAMKQAEGMGSAEEMQQQQAQVRQWKSCASLLCVGA